MQNKILPLLGLSLLAGCAAEYQRVPIPPQERDHSALSPPPELRPLQWQKLNYQGRIYYALDERNMEQLNHNLSEIAKYQASEVEAFRQYETKHPVATTKVVQHKGFWISWTKWWLGCDDPAFQSSPSCKNFIAPPDFHAPEAQPERSAAQ